MIFGCFHNILVRFSNRNTAFEKYKFTKCVIILFLVWLDWISTWSAFPGKKISLELFYVWNILAKFLIEKLMKFHWKLIFQLTYWKIVEIELKFLWTSVATFRKLFLKFLWNFVKNKFFNKKSLKLNWIFSEMLFQNEN